MSKTLDAAKVAGYPYTDGGKLDVLGDEGIIPTGTRVITENGTDIDVYDFAKVDVDVPAPQPTGKTTITENGENIDIAQYATADVDVTTYESEYSGLIERGSSTTNIEIPDGVTAIGNDAFYGMEYLEGITIPETVTSIGSGAFNSCIRLTNVAIPESVTSIGAAAFFYCTALTAITIPESITALPINCFADCYTMQSIYLPSTLTELGSESLKVRASTGTYSLDIYFGGTQVEWEALTGLSDAGIPAGATIHYEYTPAE